jgi:hypothetical protein
MKVFKAENTESKKTCFDITAENVNGLEKMRKTRTLWHKISVKLALEGLR